MVVAELNLPDDCWEHVFQFLNDDYDDNNDLKSVSLASKEFLSITNRYKLSLTVCDPTRPFLHRLFKRFTNLTSLDLTYFHGDLDALLSQIACFRLKLTSLNISNKPTIPANGLRAFYKKISTLTSLTCSNIEFINNTDLVSIAYCFPLLEELDLSNRKESAHDNISLSLGINALSSALFKLRKINFCGHYNINDSCLLNFCKNCKFLEEVIMLSCPFLTHDGIACAVRERPTLRSLSVSWRSDGSHDNISSHFIDSSVCLKRLVSLNLSSFCISDELLSSIAKGGLPLRRLVLQNCTGHSYDGIFSLLSKCECIQHLDLQNNDFLNDHHIVKLSLFLRDLVSINVSDCWRLTESSLFSLIRKCPLLGEIKMERTSIWNESVENSRSLVDFAVSFQLKSLYLACSSFLSDENIKMFSLIFPNLQLLDLRDCYNISEEGIIHVLRRCCNIRHLNLACCSIVKLRGMKFEVPKLKVLNLSHTRVDDEVLCVISKSCSGLLQLLLEGCHGVTEMGVKHVVENCTQLREINLARCIFVHPNIVDKMIFLRPSLRKIIAPPCYRLSRKMREHCSGHGCLIIN